MKIVADLQVHSRFARAVSNQMTIPVIAEWAAKKGIGLVATGDWTHPLWLRELQANLVEAGEGVYKYEVPASLRSGYLLRSLRRERNLAEAENSSHSSTALRPRFSAKADKNLEGPLFLLSTEISSIYSQGGKVRRIHTLIFAPNFETVEKINHELIIRGANLMSDGRPIVGLTAKQVAEIALSVDSRCLIVPAHAWTPHFSLYGSISGFDSIEECFGDLSSEIYAIETGLSCYDSKTEVLTEGGWKKINQITKKDKMCTLNLETEEIEYQTPQRIYQSRYRGKMYRLKTKRVDLLITPNHNLLYAPADFHTKRPFRLKDARTLFGRSKILRKDGIWKGKIPKYFILPSVKIRHGSRFYSDFREKRAKKFPIKPWLKFFGFWIAEGWTTIGRRGDYNVCISNRDENLMSEMRQILEGFGYSTYWDKRITKALRVRDYQLFYYLKQFGKAPEKHVPMEIKTLSKELLEIFFSYYLKGDGHVYGRGGKGMSATTISTRLRDDLQEIALKLEISAYYKLHIKKGTLFSSPLQRKKYKQSADSWNIYFIRHNRHAIIPSEMKKYGQEECWVEYDDMVYCVSVPNRSLYIRRNGIPLWCGNSDPAMNWRIEELKKRRIVSFSDAHSPAKMGREATVFEMPEISYENVRKAITKTSADSRILYTIEFYPEEGKYHYTGHRNCKVVYSPNETRKMGTTCPVCGKKLTVGVMSRVEELARGNEVETESVVDKFGVRWITNKEGVRPKYVMMVPLLEILSEALQSGVGTQKVISNYELLINNFDNEFNVLLGTEISEIERIAGPRVSEAISKVRSGDISIEPGYDGVFGKVKIWKEEEQKDQAPIDQGTLF